MEPANNVSANDVRLVLDNFMQAMKNAAEANPDMSPQSIMVAQLFMLQCSFQTSEYTKKEVLDCLQSLINRYDEDNIGEVKE